MSEKIKAATLSATKGLSRVQAERAAANATRNVNAYGQKEEGPSRWQERKEAKTQMYLKSTEKQVILNQKRCQKCSQTGHWTYECQKQPPENPKLSYDLNGVNVEKDEKVEKGTKKKKKKKKEKSSKQKNKKRKHRSSSESSDSDSDREDHGSRRKRKRHGHRSNGGR